MLNSRQTYWPNIKTTLSVLIYILSVTTGCGVLATEINIARIGPTLVHPWGLTSLDSQRVLVTTRPGSLYLINTSTQISKKINNTPKCRRIPAGWLTGCDVPKNRGRNCCIPLLLQTRFFIRKQHGCFSSNIGW